MNVRADIRDGEQITLPVLVNDIDEWDDHSHIARKVSCEDGEGNSVSLTIFHNNDAASFEWETDEWYRLTNAMGNIYNDDRQLNPGYDFEIEQLEGPPEDAVQTEIIAGGGGGSGTTSGGEFKAASSLPHNGQTTFDGGTGSERDGLADRNYLLHFSLGELSGLVVNEYRLNIPGGLDPNDDLDGGTLGFTARVAARYRHRTGVPVTTNGPLKLYAVEELDEDIAVGGYTVQPTATGTETLEACHFDEREPLREMVKQDVKAALGGRYNVTAINSIIEYEPQIEADSGDFIASREYACRIWIDADGSVICGISTGFHLQSTFSAAEYVDRGYDIEGVSVEHDTEVYDRTGTGIVTRQSDTGYTDHVDEIGTSIEDYHRSSGIVDGDLVDRLADGDPHMARIKYGQHTEGLQALELCRIVPSLDQLKLVDERFHERFQQLSRQLPQKRFDLAIGFIGGMRPTPALGLEPNASPTNECYDELNVDTGKPNLRFGGDRTALYGKAGLSNHGVYRAPDSFNLLGIYPERYAKRVQNFFEELLGKLDEYDSPATALNQESYELGSEFNYTQVGREHDLDDIDGIVAVVPESERAVNDDSIDDPYPEFKRHFGQEKLPSQMVTLDNLSKSYYLGNIASGLVAKVGGIPWRIHEVPGGSDVFVGLDVTYDHETGQHLGASANIVMADGTILASETVSLQQGETFDIDDVVEILKNLLRIYVRREGSSPSHLIIHRDGQFYLDVEKLVDRLDDAGDFFPQFDLVEIRKSGNPRIAEHVNNSFEVADKGTGFISRNADHAYLATTGKPEIKSGNSIGTPRPVRVVKRHGSTGLDTLTKQVYWLSEAHVGSISRSTRLPITTYYADRCAEHGRKKYLLRGEVVEGVPYI